MPDGPLRVGLGARVYGCDVCQEVCPWNSRPVTSARPEWQPQASLDARTLRSLWEASDAELDAIRLRGPMSRVSTPGLRRNLAIAIGNAGGLVPASAFDAAEAGDPARPSLADAAVLDAVTWARRRLEDSADAATRSRPSAGRIMDP